MDITSSGPSRSLAALVSILAIGSLVAQVAGNMQRGDAFFPVVGWMFQFFTIWGNLAAGLVFGWIAVSGRVEPRVPFALAAALVIIAAVYHLLLASAHHPEGIDWWTNIAHHTLVPAGGVLWWLLFSRDGLAGWRSLPIVMLVPVIYGAFALVNGALTGFYPYFFLDQPSLGLGMVLLNMVGLAIIFMAVAALLLLVRKLIRAAA
ncbi:Pr6Pr family membrane protein [Qipengyuania sp. 1NDH17]|uniref:Pr6Pr family membrane protein n=1 Tax=Qipengyuania polymorpha TaxID=2867234 RepID=A0ABS7J012_9SPHN|nr:Pr6Pr family membrane protein [Qipengyuania polymorpha]MBX7459043.1 Pr6Pr family membrane protein [Qipengyuania polymorpha]